MTFYNDVFAFFCELVTLSHVLHAVFSGVRWGRWTDEVGLVRQWQWRPHSWRTLWCSFETSSSENLYYWALYQHQLDCLRMVRGQSVLFIVYVFISISQILISFMSFVSAHVLVLEVLPTPYIWNTFWAFCSFFVCFCCLHKTFFYNIAFRPSYFQSLCSSDSAGLPFCGLYTVRHTNLLTFLVW